MKLGVMTPYQMAPIDTGEYASGFGRLAEDLGFESVWIAEHVVTCVHCESIYPYDPSGRSPLASDASQPDPLIWLSYIAGVTRRVRLATGILILPQRNPVVLAKAVATLDRISGGRMLLGIGVGWSREEAKAVGASFDDRGRRTDEYLQAMRALWREPVSSFRGNSVSFENVVSEPRPAQAGGVPIIVGGHSKAAARRAGRLGDGFFPLRVAAGTTPGAWDAKTLSPLRSIMEETARENGRDPSSIEITCAGTATVELARLYESLGVHRMMVYPGEGDLDRLRGSLEPFVNALRRGASSS